MLHVMLCTHGRADVGPRCNSLPCVQVLAEHISTVKLYATVHNYEVNNNGELIM